MLFLISRLYKIFILFVFNLLLPVLVKFSSVFLKIFVMANLKFVSGHF